MWKELVILLFMVITGLNWAYYQFTAEQITSTDVALNIFVEVLGTGLTILVLDRLWYAEERKRWREVRNEVNRLIRREFDGNFLVLASILVPIKAFEFQTNEELDRKTRKYQEDELTKLARGDVNEIGERITRMKRLLEDPGYGDFFQKEYESLNNIEMKYSKFLEPSIQRMLIKLETSMKSLATNIRVRFKLKDQKFGKFWIPSVEKSIFHRVYEIVKILNEAREAGLLELLSSQ